MPTTADPPSKTAPLASDDLSEEFFEFLSVERNVSPRTLDNYEHALLEFRRRYTRFQSWFDCTADDFRRALRESGRGRDYAFEGCAVIRY